MSFDSCPGTHETKITTKPWNIFINPPILLYPLQLMLPTILIQHSFTLSPKISSPAIEFHTNEIIQHALCTLFLAGFFCSLCFWDSHILYLRFTCFYYVITISLCGSRITAYLHPQMDIRIFSPNLWLLQIIKLWTFMYECFDGYMFFISYE